MNPAALSALMNGDIANAIVASTPGGIERQERQGQEDLVRNGARLPAKVNSPRDLGIQEVARRLGITLGEPVDGIFISATLPKGWSLKATEHAMWSELLDDKGRKRGSIFYKAAFYDRSAHLNVEGRYHVRNDYAKPTSTVSIKDGATGESVHVVGTHAYEEYEEGYKLERLARVWLEANLPQHEDQFAYWD